MPGHRDRRTPSARTPPPRPSRSPPGSPSGPPVSPPVRRRLIALAVGVVGALGVGLSMRDASASAAAAGRLGMRRVQSNMDDILALLAMPALLFFVILALWSAVDLVRLYRVANDPDRFRRRRSRHDG